MRYCAVALLVTALASSSQASTFTPLVLTGDVAPGTSGQTFIYFGERAPINNRGDVAFAATYWDGQIGGIRGQGVYSSLSPIALSGEEAPGTNGMFFREFGVNGVNDSGNVLYFSRFEGSGDSDIGYFDKSGLVIRRGDTIPGTGEPFVGAVSAHIDNAGRIYFLTELESTGGQPNTDEQRAIVGPNGVIVQRGDLAPLGTGETFSAISGDIDVSRNGRIVFGAEVGERSFPGLFSLDSSLAFSLEPAPGIPDAVFVSPFNSEARINNGGSVAFRATAIRDRKFITALYFDDEVLALGGDPAPGTGGLLFGELVRQYGVALNDRGEVVFGAELVDSSGQRAGVGYYRWSAGAGLRYLFKSGDALDLGLDGVRTLFSVGVFGIDLNNRGDIAFTARFEDNGVPTFGVIVDVAVVPVPASLPLLTGGLIALVAVRRRIRREARRAE